MGAVSGVLLYLTGWKTIPLFGWRVVVALGALPSLIAVVLVAFFVPRSPRHLLLMGKKAAAEEILKKIAVENGQSLEDLSLNLVLPGTKECEEFGLGCIFSRRHICLTLSLLITWFCIGFLHYGAVLLGTVLPDSYSRDCGPTRRSDLVDTSCGCLRAAPVHVVPLVAGAIGEAASLVFPWLLARFAGRRTTFAIGGALAACIFGLHAICKSEAWLSLLLFFNRAVTLGLFLTAILYTSEVFPTSARAVSVGLGSSANRIGNLLAPFVAQVMVEDVSLLVAMIIFIVFGLAIFVLAFAGLQVETKDRPLYDTFAELEAAEKLGEGKSYRTFPSEPDRKND